MRYTPKFIVKTSLIAIVSGFIVGFTLFQAQNLMQGPTIIVTSPDGGHGTRSEVAEIRGVAKNIAFISFNDRRIFTDKDGAWSEKLVLAEGYNIVKLTAKDKFGRTVEKTVELVYEAPEDQTLTARNTTDEYGQAN